jgi:hypothetical protein
VKGSPLSVPNICAPGLPVVQLALLLRTEPPLARARLSVDRFVFRAGDAVDGCSGWGQEASILRVEALVEVGDRSAAERAADEFLRKNPTTPYAARVRSLVGAPNR